MMLQTDAYGGGGGGDAVIVLGGARAEAWEGRLVRAQKVINKTCNNKK